jgi:hypothetical protein
VLLDVQALVVIRKLTDLKRKIIFYKLIIFI